jgi:hypothetical protein
LKLKNSKKSLIVMLGLKEWAYRMLSFKYCKTLQAIFHKAHRIKYWISFTNFKKPSKIKTFIVNRSYKIIKIIRLINFKIIKIINKIIKFLIGIIINIFIINKTKQKCIKWLMINLECHLLFNRIWIQIFQIINFQKKI